jgi:nitronate monooxygenase
MVAHREQETEGTRPLIHTRFTEMFDLEHPVMSAPMAMHSGGTLAAAVSEAGGLGSFGGLSAGGPDWIRAQASLVRQHTDRPFAIGFITSLLASTAELFDVALESRPAAIALSFSDPGVWGRRVKDVGCRLICQVQTFAAVDDALAAGADVLAAQGNEAGGHTGTMGLLPLLCGIAEQHPEVPLLAAGGIADGRALAAALLAGADGAWMGTSFLATNEAVEIPEEYRRAVVASDGGDTVFTEAYDIASGVPWPAGTGARMQRDSFTDEWHGREAELRERANEVDLPVGVRFFGQSARFVEGIRPAGDVVRSITDAAAAVLAERPGHLIDPA